MTNVNYGEEVMKLYPEAYCYMPDYFDLYIVMSGDAQDIELGSGYNRTYAWEDAYEKLVKAGKITVISNLKKTALQQAIEQLDIKIKTIIDVREHNKHADVVLQILKQEREDLITLLPIEQQQIEQAYDDGRADGENGTLHFSYYTKNYDNEQHNG